MRIALRIAEFLRDAFFELLRDEVLQTLGIIVQFVNWVAQHLEEKRLYETMMPDDFQSPSSARRGQPHTFATPVINERFRLKRQLLEHIGDRSWRDLQASRKFRTKDPPPLIAAQRVDSLQVIVDGLRVSRPMSLASFFHNFALRRFVC
jgi:hypothetical protein